MQLSDLILYNNNQLIAFNKPPGMAVQTASEKDKSLHQLAEIYCKHPLKVIHRIDRPSSGICIFGKNKNAAMYMSKQFKERKIEKYYLAVVGRQKTLEKGSMEDLLYHNKKNNKSYVVQHKDDGAKQALLQYEKIGNIERYQLLKIKLESGRHHQIRCQLASRNLPIKGDVKYGDRRGHKDRSILLHAWQLAFMHPISNKKETLIANVPKHPIWEAFDEHFPDLNLFSSKATFEK